MFSASPSTATGWRLLLHTALQTLRIPTPQVLVTKLHGLIQTEVSLWITATTLLSPDHFSERGVVVHVECLCDCTERLRKEGQSCGCVPKGRQTDWGRPTHLRHCLPGLGLKYRGKLSNPSHLSLTPPAATPEFRFFSCGHWGCTQAP